MEMKWPDMTRNEEMGMTFLGMRNGNEPKARK